MNRSLSIAEKNRPVQKNLIARYFQVNDNGDAAGQGDEVQQVVSAYFST
jgi:hypothetical protein